MVGRSPAGEATEAPPSRGPTTSSLPWAPGQAPQVQVRAGHGAIARAESQQLSCLPAPPCSLRNALPTAALPPRIRHPQVGTPGGSRTRAEGRFRKCLLRLGSLDGDELRVVTVSQRGRERMERFWGRRARWRLGPPSRSQSPGVRANPSPAARKDATVPHLPAGPPRPRRAVRSRERGGAGRCWHRNALNVLGGGGGAPASPEETGSIRGRGQWLASTISFGGDN